MGGGGLKTPLFSSFLKPHHNELHTAQSKIGKITAFSHMLKSKGY